MLTKRIALCIILTLGGLTMRATALSQQEIQEAVDRNRQWAEAAFSEHRGAIPTDLLTVAHDDEPGTAKLNRCAAGGLLRLGEKTYQRGIGVNSNCTLRVRLRKPAARFLADIGVDRNVDKTPASLRFHVQRGDQKIFSTDVMRPTGEIRPIDVPLAGATEFDLVVDDGGDGRSFDQGDWADARIVFPKDPPRNQNSYQ
jgi:hypothetical protein